MILLQRASFYKAVCLTASVQHMQAYLRHETVALLKSQVREAVDDKGLLRCDEDSMKSVHLPPEEIRQEQRAWKDQERRSRDKQTENPLIKTIW